MSNEPIVFTEDDLKRFEDRMAELERLWPVMQKKLQTYDALIRDNKSMSGDISDVRAQTEACKAALQGLTDRHVATSSSLDKSVQSLNSAVVDLKNAATYNADSHSSLCSVVKGQSDDLNKKVDDVKAYFKGALSNVANSSEVALLKDYIDRKFQDVSKDVDTVKRDLVLSNSYATATSDKTSDHADRLDSIETSIVNLSKKIGDLTNLPNVMNDNVASMLSKTKEDTVSSVDTKLKALKDELSASPDAIKNVRDEFVKKIEGVALDGSNAVLRSSNSERKIVILEKKIENIYLLLQKLETPK
jgi:chromosome segregation ATPase